MDLNEFSLYGKNFKNIKDKFGNGNSRLYSWLFAPARNVSPEEEAEYIRNYYKDILGVDIHKASAEQVQLITLDLYKKVNDIIDILASGGNQQTAAGFVVSDYIKQDAIRFLHSCPLNDRLPKFMQIKVKEGIRNRINQFGSNYNYFNPNNKLICNTSAEKLLALKQQLRSGTAFSAEWFIQRKPFFPGINGPKINFTNLQLCSKKPVVMLHDPLSKFSYTHFTSCLSDVFKETKRNEKLFSAKLLSGSTNGEEFLFTQNVSFSGKSLSLGNPFTIENLATTQMHVGINLLPNGDIASPISLMRFDMNLSPDKAQQNHVNKFIKNDFYEEIIGSVAEFPHFHFTSNESSLAYFSPRAFTDPHYKAGKGNAIDCKHLSNYIKLVYNLNNSQNKLPEKYRDYIPDLSTDDFGMPFLQAKNKGTLFNLNIDQEILFLRNSCSHKTETGENNPAVDLIESNFLKSKIPLESASKESKELQDAQNFCNALDFLGDMSKITEQTTSIEERLQFMHAYALLTEKIIESISHVYDKIFEKTTDSEVMILKKRG